METVGRYRIVRELGRGGMGVVYEAFDPLMDRTVALKVILCLAHSSAEEYAQLKKRFLREAAAAGRLSHPNIVHMNNLGEEDGLPYLDMDFVAGKPLKAMLAPGVPASLETALAILTQIAAALDHAHAKGIVHRDIKPPNILVEPDGAVKLTDFGIAHISSQTITRTGVTMGTVPYMSPEQLMAKDIDGRTDQFSLAVMAYEMLAGQLPFVAPTDAVLTFKIVGEEARPLHEVNALLPRTVSQVVSRALSKTPEKRYGTCSEFIGELRTAAARAAYTPTKKEYVAPVRPGPEVTHRLQRWPLVAGCGVLALGIGAWLVYRANNGTGGTGPAPESAKVQPAAKQQSEPQVPPETETKAPPSSGKRVEQKEETVRPAPQPPVPQGPARKVNDKDGLTYVWIPAGTFQMGCSQADSECYDDEKPAHEVTITKGFWMGQTPVTQVAYQRVIGSNPSHFHGEELPVETVSWNDAQRYCEKAGMRLPTEAEWEYAARGAPGNTPGRYGDVGQIAWYDKNSGSTTHPVAQKLPNKFGLYDMLGNVWEWVSDFYANKYPDGPQQNPTGAASGQYHSLRGGSWLNLPSYARASDRYGNVPESRDYYIGLRCAGN
jgi:formylglycine-generating enzyme required for sulfatase activity